MLFESGKFGISRSITRAKFGCETHCREKDSKSAINIDVRLKRNRRSRTNICISFQCPINHCSNLPFKIIRHFGIGKGHICDRELPEYSVKSRRDFHFYYL